MSEHDERRDYREPRFRRRGPEALVKEPADFMWSLGLFQMGASLFAAFLAVSAAIDALVNGLEMRAEQVARAGGIVVLSAIGTVIGGVVVRGAAAMRRLEGYSKARTAAVLTLFSLPFIVAAPFSTPVGIWALVILRRPEVRSRFDDPGQSAAP